MMQQDKHHLLSVQNIAVAFEANGRLSRAVDEVSFDVSRGETVCIVGESGCGKTVTALTILGLIPQPPGRIIQGQILFNGKDLLAMDQLQLQKVRGKHIGMIFQDPMTSLNPVFNIKDQIAEAIQAHEKVSSGQVQQRCLQALKSVGIDSAERRMRNYPHQLSGGQRQRVMIAMTLACNPELIIADEPTTALDVTIQAQIIRLLHSVQKEGHRSVLYITHDLGVVANVADRVYVMYAGIIVEHGDVHQIFKEPKHPYTMGLMSSLPALSKRGHKLPIIPGAVPDPLQKPGGCPFHPRCSFACSTCRDRFPQMVDLGRGHLTRCPVIVRK